MARIELKNATIRLRDGFSNTAKVNKATPLTGDTTLPIDTLGTSGVIPVSSLFSIVGSTNRYTVTGTDANAELTIDLGVSTGGTYTVTIGGQVTSALAFGAIQSAIQSAVDALSNVLPGDFLVTKVSDDITIKALSTGLFANIAVVMSSNLGSLTGGAPTQTQTAPGGVSKTITFTPALLTADGIPIDNADMTFTGRSLEVKVGDGDLSFTENRNFTYDLDRGRLDTVRQGDEAPIDVTLDFIWENLTALPDSETPTIEDVLHHRGAAADWESSSDDPCEPFCIDIEVEYVPPCGATGTEFITLPEFRWATLPHSISDAQISMTGQCNATEVLASRSAA